MKSCDFDGNQLTTLKPTSTVLAPMMILVYKNLLVIKVYEKKSEPTLMYDVSDIDMKTLTDLHILDLAVQPEQQGPCYILNGECEHICIPIGRYRECKCEYGYQLDIDNRTCVSSLLTNNFLVVTDWTQNAMYQVSLVNDDVRAIDTNTYGSPTAVAYNFLSQEVFWSTKVLIHSLSLKDNSYKVLFNTEFLSCHAHRFAIDYPSGNIYYIANPTSQTGFAGVGVISPQGLHRRLITIESQPSDIVLDSEEGLMFWTDNGSDPAFLAKANMDGTSMSYVIRDSLGWPNGLAIDSQANILYITDGKTNIIYKCSYFGVCKNHYTDRGSHLMDIIMIGDYLYYTALNRPYIFKMHKTDPVSVIKVGNKPELGRLDSLAFHSSLLNQSKSSSCSSNNGLGPCSTFCLPKAARYVCACEDNVAMRSDGKTCQNVKLQVTRTASTTTVRNEKNGTTVKPSSIPTAVAAGVSVGILALGIITCVLVCFIVKRSSNTKNNTSGRQNTAQVQFGYEIAYLTPPVQNTSRPNLTYNNPDEVRRTDVSLSKNTINKYSGKKNKDQVQFGNDRAYLTPPAQITSKPNSTYCKPDDRRTELHLSNSTKTKYSGRKNKAQIQLSHDRAHLTPHVRNISIPNSTFYNAEDTRTEVTFSNNNTNKYSGKQNKAQVQFGYDRAHLTPHVRNSSRPNSANYNPDDSRTDVGLSNNAKNNYSGQQNIANIQICCDIATLTSTIQNTSRTNSTYYNQDDRKTDLSLSYNTKNTHYSGQQNIPDIQIGYDMDNLTPPLQNTSRPNSTYDYPDDSSSEDEMYIYMKVTKINSDQRELSSEENEVQKPNLRPSAVKDTHGGIHSRSSNVSRNDTGGFNQPVYKDTPGRHVKPKSHFNN